MTCWAAPRAHRCVLDEAWGWCGNFDWNVRLLAWIFKAFELFMGKASGAPLYAGYRKPLLKYHTANSAYIVERFS
jgi:hypothetical protein